MTTCPRCGRVADDEVVCAGCGLSLALTQRTAAAAGAESSLIDEFAVDDGSGDKAQALRVWRLVGLVGLVCALAAAAAIVLLNQHGSGKANAGLPVIIAPGTSASTTDSPTASGTPRSSTSPIVPTSPIRSTSTAPTPSRSTSPRASRPATRSTSSTAKSTPPSTTPSRTKSVPAHSVHVAQGAADAQCGPHCYLVSVLLSGFSGGTHQITCQAVRGGTFGQYTTSSDTSAQCAYRRPNDSVWVVVDGQYRSNTLAWAR